MIQYIQCKEKYQNPAEYDRNQLQFRFYLKKKKIKGKIKRKKFSCMIYSHTDIIENDFIR